MEAIFSLQGFFADLAFGGIKAHVPTLEFFPFSKDYTSISCSKMHNYNFSICGMKINTCFISLSFVVVGVYF